MEKRCQGEARLVVCSGLSVLPCSHHPLHQHLEARVTASQTRRGARVAQGIRTSVLSGTATSARGRWEMGYLSRDVQTDRLVKTRAFRAISGIWFQAKMNKNNEITRVKIFHELGAALTWKAAGDMCET